MKKTAAIACIVSLLLYSCNQNKPAESQIPVVGEAIDSAAIAQSSYEYAQTVIVNPKLVYDVRAYGGPPSHGEYCIIRRGADNKPDTVVQAERFGIIVNAFTADLNNNGKEEIYVITQSADTDRLGNVIAFEFDGHGKSTAINVHFETEKTWNYSGKDSIYLDDKIAISRLFPIFNKQNKTGGWMRINYRLNNNELSHVSAEGIKKP
jgi:hypothetical protein